MGKIVPVNKSLNEGKNNNLQRFLLILACVIVFIIFALQKFTPQYTLPSADDLLGNNTEVSTQIPEQALAEIYFNVSIMGVIEATPERLESDFGIDSSIYSSCVGRYTDGRFGIADVIMLSPRPGFEDEVREALQTIKLSRINLFRNYDIYNSYQLAEEGLIFQRGDYYILTMIENAATVREIIETYIPR